MADGQLTDQGKFQAIGSYFSLITGWPIFLWPLVVRDDAFGLQHGKWAGGLYVGYMITVFAVVFISFATCGLGSLLIFLLFLWWIPAAMGVLSALNGKLEAPIGAEPLATMLFGTILPKDQDPPKLPG
jgi:hypothetical protein